MPVNIQAYNKNPHFGDFQEMLKASIPLVVRQKQLQQQQQQFQQNQQLEQQKLIEEADRARIKMAQKAFEIETDIWNEEQDRIMQQRGIGVRKQIAEDKIKATARENKLNRESMDKRQKLSSDQAIVRAIQTGDMETYDKLMEVQKAKASKTTVKNILNPGFGKLTEAQGKQLVEGREEVEGSAAGLRNITEAKQLLDQGIITGSGAKYIVGFGNFLSERMGIKFEDDPIGNTQAYAAAMGRQVGEIIRAFGAGTGLSDADREYAEGIAGGKITMTESALRKLIGINERVYIAKIKEYNKKASKVMEKEGAEEALLYDLRVDMPEGYEEKNTAADYLKKKGF